MLKKRVDTTYSKKLTTKTENFERITQGKEEPSQRCKICLTKPRSKVCGERFVVVIFSDLRRGNPEHFFPLGHFRIVCGRKHFY